MPVLTANDGVRLSYRARGSGRPSFLFVHGWCSNARHWEAQLRHFARQHRVLAPDRRGHGRSDAPERGYTVTQHADDLTALLRLERLRSVIAVGHAGGGAATLDLARRHPRLVRAVVLVDSRVDPAARLDDPNDAAGAAYAAILARLRGREGQKALRTMYSGFFSRNAGAAGRTALREALETPLPVAAAELESLTIDAESIAREVTQPVLWLSVAAADQGRLASLFRSVQFGELVGSGHFPQIEVPDQLNAMIRRFVATL
jgi:pimeloyl-ACP methyl ester carboxylesterase